MDKKQILIVDDESDVLSVLEKGLTAEGYSVTTVTSAKSLDTALLLTELPDLIILDIGLQDINGSEIAARLKENPKTKDIPVLFLSALYSKEEDVKKRGIFDGNIMLTKPYEMKELAIEVKKLLERKKKILIVDDEMDTRLVLEKGLTAEGYSVITAYNGKNALSIARSKYLDLIILDRVLGDMLGEEVAAKLREDPRTKDIPIIFLSALFSKRDEMEMGHVFGDEKMFAKPYDMEKLLTAIEELLFAYAAKV